jgi:hypothetical protein
MSHCEWRLAWGLQCMDEDGMSLEADHGAPIAFDLRLLILIVVLVAAFVGLTIWGTLASAGL